MTISKTIEQQINELHDSLMGQLRQTLETAIQIGRLLTDKKAELKHGEFTPWMKENLVFSDRTARNYMTLYENRDKALKAGNITEAYKMLEQPKTETVSDFTEYLQVIDSAIDLIKYCNRFFDEPGYKDGDPFFMPKGELMGKIIRLEDIHHEKIHQILSIIPTIDTIDNIQTAKIYHNLLEQNLYENKIIQSRIGKLIIWYSRLLGLATIATGDSLYTEDIPGIDTETCLEYARTSYDTLEGVINQ